jgi:uncharacterized protein (DUF4415 family)
MPHNDEDNPEWSVEDFKRARPLRNTKGGPAIIAGMAKLAAEQRKKIGRPPVENPKQAISLRLSPDLIAALRAALARGRI